MLAFRNAALGALAASLAASCGAHPPHGEPTAVAIQFQLAVNGEPFSCVTAYPSVGNNESDGGTTFRGSYARFYVHDVALLDQTGAAVPVTLTADGVWQLPASGVAMIDAENGGSCAGASGNLAVRGTVPAGTYQGLSFKVGLPNAVNHLFADTQPSPLNQTAMFWTWTSGYRFLRIEGLDANKKALNGGLLHLGSTGCTPNEAGDLSKGSICAYPNLVPVQFDAFDPLTNRVVLDVGQLFADTDIMVNKGGAAGCMSGLTDPECPALFKKLGLPYGDGLLPDGGVNVVQPTTAQTVFTKQ